MKKYLVLILLSGFYFFFSECTPQKKQTAYIVPDEYSGQTRANFVAMLEYGQKLYKLKCSKCHGIFSKGRDSIPNFSKTELENYSAAALMDDPKNHAVIQKLRPEDLDMILQFLAFRRPPAKN